MRHETVTEARRTGFDWKAAGYVISIASVLFLGAIAWPKSSDPQWHLPVLIAGMTLSMIGMGFRYKAHLDQQREMRETRDEAERG